MTYSPFTAQQVGGAIRAGLRSSRQNYNLTAVEAQEKSATYRNNLARYRNNLAHYRNVALRSVNGGDYLHATEKS